MKTYSPGQCPALKRSAVQISNLEAKPAIIATSPRDWIRPGSPKKTFHRGSQSPEKTEPIKPVEINIVRNDRHEITVLDNTVWITHNGLPATLTVLQDITEQKRALEIVIRQQKELNEINRIANIANSSLALDVVLKLILENVTTAIKASAGLIFLKDLATGHLTLGAAFGLPEEFITDCKDTPIRMGEGLNGTIAQTGEPIFIQKNLSSDHRIVHPVFIKEPFNSFLGIPIIAENEIVGVMNILTHPPAQVKERDKHFCSTVGSQVGLAIINAKKYSELKKTKEALQESETRLKALHEFSFGGIAIHDQGIILECNQALSEMTGYEYSELIGMNISMLIAEKSRKTAFNNILTGYEKPYEVMGLCKDEKEFHLRIRARNVPYKGRQVRYTEFRDISDQKSAESEKEKLQAQLNQAQKLESVGRLAGGVAHDFNNMLGVILGHTELALLQADENHDLYSDLKEIQNAAHRSADITKQLLAFARKQTISPRQIYLNDTVESMLSMLRRLIGEDIDLVWKPAAHNWPVKMDPSQIDQILANLCVNARDAISDVGKLTIEKGSGQRHRPGACYRLWHRQTEQRVHHCLQRTRPGFNFQNLSAPVF